MSSDKVMHWKETLEKAALPQDPATKRHHIPATKRQHILPTKVTRRLLLLIKKLTFHLEPATLVHSQAEDHMLCCMSTTYHQITTLLLGITLHCTFKNTIMVMAITFIMVLTDTTLIQEMLSTFNQVEVVSSVPSLVFAFVSASLLVSGAVSLVNVVAVAVVEMMVEMKVELSLKKKLLLSRKS